jgi:hypothetical protein
MYLTDITFINEEILISGPSQKHGGGFTDKIF